MDDRAYDAASFWAKGYRRHGHTGDGDVRIYACDQPLRLRAVEKSASTLVTRNAYIDLLSRNRFRLVQELGLPRIGVRMWRSLQRLGGRFALTRVGAANAMGSSSGGTLATPRRPSVRRLIGAAAQGLVLHSAWVSDRLPLWPARLTDMRILTFRAAVTPG